MSLTEFLGRHEYSISLVIAVVALMSFAYRQLKIPLPEDSEIKFEFIEETETIRASGSGAVKEAYFYFLFLILLLFVLLTFSETFYNFLTRDKTGGLQADEKYLPQNPTWPITVALLIATASGSFPLIKDVEIFFRKVARYSAGIHRNFEKMRSRLRAFKFPEDFSDADSYGHDLRSNAELIKFVFALSGETRPNVDKYAQTVRKSLLLNYWTSPNNQDVTWTSSSAQKILSEADPFLQEMEELRTAVEAGILSLEECYSGENNLSHALREAFPDGFKYDAKAEDASKDIFEKCNGADEKLEALRLVLDKLSENLGKQEELFTLLAIHDQYPTTDGDRAARELIRFITSF